MEINNILEGYSLGPDWFREGVKKAKEKLNNKKTNISEKYALHDPNNGKVLLIDGIPHLRKGSEKKYVEEISYAIKEYDKEIDLLKDRLLFIFPSKE